MNKEAKTISKILRIIMTIFKGLTYVGILLMALFIVLTPVLFNNIKIDNKTQSISLGEEEVTYELANNRFSLAHNNDELVSIKLDSKNAVKVNKLIHQEKKYYILVTEYILITVVILLTLGMFILKELEALFGNIEKETPFTKENVNIIQEVAKYIIILEVVTYLLMFFLQIIIGLDLSIRFNISIIIYILMIYLLAYIFDYGIKKEK